MKDRFDKKQRVRPPTISISDWVRIRRPHRDNKLQSFWSDPIQVSQQLGPASFRLADGTRWHAGRLRKVPAPSGPRLCIPGAIALPAAQLDVAAAPVPAAQPDVAAPPPLPEVAPEPRPIRARSRPEHLRDFVTEYHS